MSAINDLLVIRLKATAALQMQCATVLTGKGQDELRQTFIDASTLMLEAAKALSKAEARP